jgi:phosphoglycolate phosphatase
MGPVIFDLDGTLVDSAGDITAALAAAMRDAGLPTVSEATVRGWIGGGARSLIRRAVPSELVEAVLARFGVHYAAAPVVHSRLYPGIAAALDRLASRPLAVLSNKPDALLGPICDRLLARWPFRAIVGQRDGVPLKPDPAAALAIAGELGAAPASCTLVGDAGSDVATARAAGMTAIAVSWGYRPRDELVAAGPARVLDDPAQLAEL